MSGIEAKPLKFVNPLLKTLCHKLLRIKEKLKLNPKTPSAPAIYANFWYRQRADKWLDGGAQVISSSGNSLTHVSGENGFLVDKLEKENMACIQNLGFSDLPNIYNITFPVGPNMPNVREDVLLVQTLMKLANFTRNNGGSVEASRSIKVDGRFGDQTKQMIEAFEIHIREKHLLLIADGVFEPSSNDGYTAKGFIYKIIHLNRFAKQATSFRDEYNRIATDAETHPILRQSLLTRRQTVPICD